MPPCASLLLEVVSPFIVVGVASGLFEGHAGTVCVTVGQETASQHVEEVASLAKASCRANQTQSGCTDSTEARIVYQDKTHKLIKNCSCASASEVADGECV